MTIKIELSEDQAKALLEFLEVAPFQNSITEDAFSMVRNALRKAVGLSQ